MVKTYILKLDNQILLKLERNRNSLLNVFFTLITQTGTGKAWMILAATMIVAVRLRIPVLTEQELFLKAMYAPLFAWPLSSLLKKVIKRNRPFIALKNFRPLTKSPTCYSFPSTHSATTFSLFVALLILGHPLALPVYMWASLVAFSRVYLGVHFPSDVLAGMLLGAFAAFILMMTF